MEINQVLATYFSQIRDSFNLSIGKVLSSNLTENFDEDSPLMICGMGGSAQGGEFLKNLTDNVLVSRDYCFNSKFVKNGIVLLSSYSGNTEETISAFEMALSSNSKIIVQCSGGRLKNLAIANNLDYIELAGGFQPRFAVLASWFSLIGLYTNLLPNSSISKLISGKGIEYYSNYAKEKVIEMQSNLSQFSSLLNDLKSMIPIVYSSESISSANLRLRGQLQENAKIKTFGGFIPEANHNEINAYLANKDRTSYLTIFLKSANDHVRNSKRIEIMSQVLVENGYKVEHIDLSNEDKILELLNYLIFADVFSSELALQLDRDIFDIETIEKFKRLMG